MDLFIYLRLSFTATLTTNTALRETTTKHTHHSPPPPPCHSAPHGHSAARGAGAVHLMYIFEIRSMSAESLSHMAGSTVCLHFIALCITAWCALRASTYSSSLLKGVFASDSGLTRCARQYSATRVMILPQCSSLVFVQRVAWLKVCGFMPVEKISLTCATDLAMVAHASLSSATSFGSSKMPQGTWQWPPRRRSTRCRVDSFWML